MPTYICIDPHGAATDEDFCDLNPPPKFIVLKSYKFKVSQIRWPDEEDKEEKFYTVRDESTLKEGFDYLEVSKAFVKKYFMKIS